MGRFDFGQCELAPIGGMMALFLTDQLQRFFRRRLSGTVRGRCADGRDYGGIYQSTSCPWAYRFGFGREGAVLSLRPIMMTMLVATLGLLPAATSHGIGSDSQRPFAIVIVGGLISALMMSIFLLPTLYVWIARENDKLPRADLEFEEQ